MFALTKNYAWHGNRDDERGVRFLLNVSSYQRLIESKVKNITTMKLLNVSETLLHPGMFKNVDTRG